MNRHLFRVIFHRLRGLRMAAQECVASGRARNAAHAGISGIAGKQGIRTGDAENRYCQPL